MAVYTAPMSTIIAVRTTRTVTTTPPQGNQLAVRAIPGRLIPITYPAYTVHTFFQSDSTIRGAP